MVLKGRVKNGMIVLDDPQPLPEGVSVRVEIDPDGSPSRVVNFRDLFGSISVGPADGADNDVIDADLARSYDAET